jgi:CxxC motif-containing protein (DUF1111 family)
VVYSQSGIEAPAAFDGQTNGFLSAVQFDLDRTTFEGRKEEADGLGPIYNAQACAECHQAPVTGGSSQITELRVGRYDGTTYSDRPGGSLINDRTLYAPIQERVAQADNVRAFRSSLSILGAGFVEAIADSTIEEIRNRQPPAQRGTLIKVPVLEAQGARRTARFGWKNQHASLLSFAADAYLNEMGITSGLEPVENTSHGISVAAWDSVPDPEEAPTAQEPAGPDVEAFARFMRSSKAPPRDLALIGIPDVVAGRKLFVQVGCAICHTPDIQTAQPGTVVNAGTFTVPGALGGKLIHPYGDFLLHDVGTGDGIVQNGGLATRNMLRTAPLWGLRTRSRLMHDALTLTRQDAILRHAGQAASVTSDYVRLSGAQKRQLLRFLDSL